MRKFSILLVLAGGLMVACQPSESTLVSGIPNRATLHEAPKSCVALTGRYAPANSSVPKVILQQTDCARISFVQQVGSVDRYRKLDMGIDGRERTLLLVMQDQNGHPVGSSATQVQAQYLSVAEPSDTFRFTLRVPSAGHPGFEDSTRFTISLTATDTLKVIEESARVKVRTKPKEWQPVGTNEYNRIP